MKTREILFKCVKTNTRKLCVAIENDVGSANL